MKYPHPSYPAYRPRRLRRNPAVRALVRENTLTTDDLIWPIFLTDSSDESVDIPTMPGVQRFPISMALEQVCRAYESGIRCIALFPYIEESGKSADCSHALDPENLVNRATRAFKSACPEMLLMTDVALDAYNIHGHDGIVIDGAVDNDATLARLCEQAQIHAESGADILGPSDMMDGRISAIRSTLDDAGFVNTIILSYAAKFASCLYGPFRDAINSAAALVGDKKTYQLDPANADEALRMVERDIAEGADMVMVKPGLPYLDICRAVTDQFAVPTFAYQTSGEYTMIRLAIAEGVFNPDQIIPESLMAFKRAGCDGILTYFAPEAARLLRG
ncbi:MAG: porphobilinogen synthase [Rhodobacteraceae bacterium]|nr:porphobilinogen synthase [Paracoccaceae bacterium]